MESMNIFDCDINKIHEIHISPEDRFALSSASKGRQIKWFYDNKFYKADTNGNEGLAEILSSLVASCIVDFDYVPYYECRIFEGDKEYRGCYSNLFLGKDEELFSLDQLLAIHQVDSDGLLRQGMQPAFTDICNYVERLCNLRLDKCLARLLQFDAIICNEGRYFHNINIIRDGHKFRLAPSFDNGDALLSNKHLHPLTDTVEDNVRHTKARPFMSSFDKQMKIIHSMGYTPLVIDYEKLYNLLDSFQLHNYSDAEKYQSVSVILNQLKKYEGYVWTRL